MRRNNGMETELSSAALYCSLHFIDLTTTTTTTPPVSNAHVTELTNQKQGGVRLNARKPKRQIIVTILKWLIKYLNV